MKSQPPLQTVFQQAVTAHQSGDLALAERYYRQLLARDPDHTQANYLLGCVAHRTGHLKPALSLIQKALQQAPRNNQYRQRLAMVLGDLGQIEQAVELYRQVYAVTPDDPGLLNNFAAALHLIKQHDEAERHFRRALSLDPKQSNSWYNLGNLYESQGRYADAIDAYERAVQLAPGVAPILNNLARVYEAQGEFTQAIQVYRRALDADPGSQRVLSNILFLQSYNVLLDPEAMLSAHREWDKRFHCAEKAGLFKHQRPSKAGGRRLRIAYVSPDLCQHSVSYFFEPILAHHDRERVEVFCYAELIKVDEVSQHLRGLSDGWRMTRGLSDEALARQIHADGIDILVDLAGHTGGNRLGVFCYRPAPVQVSYLGYFTTTGLSTMDYWLSDAVATPQDTVERCTETIWRLPGCSLCYTPPEDAPDVVMRAVAMEPVVAPLMLGSFNDLSKVSPATIALWTAVLQALPEAELLLKARQLADSGVCEALRKAFSNHGIAMERLHLMGRTADICTHLECYARVDIALDTVPRTGGTTTAEALWMGLPVVSLAGQRYIERLSATMLAAVGQPAWVAADRASYIDIVCALARDVVGRAHWRDVSRERMRQSSLCDGKGLAQRLEDAYLSMWAAYLAGKGPHRDV